jgi:hypothetical protein
MDPPAKRHLHGKRHLREQVTKSLKRVHKAKSARNVPKDLGRNSTLAYFVTRLLSPQGSCQAEAKWVSESKPEIPSVLGIAIMMSLSARMHLENHPLAQKQSDGVGNKVRDHVDP